MKESIVVKVKLDKQEKIELEQIRKLLNQCKLPDNILYTSTFQKDKLKKQLKYLSFNLQTAQELLNSLIEKLQK